MHLSCDVLLEECSHSGFQAGGESCTHGEDVVISCTQEEAIRPGTFPSTLSSDVIASITIGIAVLVISVCTVVIVIIFFYRRSKRPRNVKITSF